MMRITMAWLGIALMLGCTADPTGETTEDPPPPNDMGFDTGTKADGNGVTWDRWTTPVTIAPDEAVSGSVSYAHCVTESDSGTELPSCAATGGAQPCLSDCGGLENNTPCSDDPRFTCVNFECSQTTFNTGTLCADPKAEIAWYVVPADVVQPFVDGDYASVQAAVSVSGEDYRRVRLGIHQTEADAWDTIGGETKLASHQRIFDGDVLSAPLSAGDLHFFVARGNTEGSFWKVGSVDYELTVQMSFEAPLDPPPFRGDRETLLPW